MGRSGVSHDEAVCKKDRGPGNECCCGKRMRWIDLNNIWFDNGARRYGWSIPGATRTQL